MRDYIYLLLWIIFLYFFSWSHTGSLRRESVLITVNKTLTKILFYIRSSNRNSRRISIFSIILGLFAHFSMIFFLFLVLFNNDTAPYMKLILIIWFWLGLTFANIGETIETFIKIKRAEEFAKFGKKRDFIILSIIGVLGTGFMIYMTVKYSLILGKLLLFKDAA